MTPSHKALTLFMHKPQALCIHGEQGSILPTFYAFKCSDPKSEKKNSQAVSLCFALLESAHVKDDQLLRT